jgi:hypothetical protein
MILGRREAYGVILRLVLWLPLLLWLAWIWGTHYGQLFLPLYRETLDWVLTDFGVVRLDIARTHECIFKTRVIAETMMVKAGQVLPSGFIVDALTPMYIALIHPVMLATAALVWPGLTCKGRILRLFLSTPFLVLLEAMDVPLVLASSINDLLSFSLDPEADAASRLLDWVNVMDGGGRYALTLAAAFAAAGVHGWIERQWRNPAPEQRPNPA